MHNLVFTQLYNIKTLKTATRFDTCGIILRDPAHKMILYKTLTNLSVVSSWCFVRDVGEFSRKL